MNMAKHIQNAAKFGVPVVVAINKYAYDHCRYSLIVARIQRPSWKQSALPLLKLVLMQRFRHGIGGKEGKVLLN